MAFDDFAFSRAHTESVEDMLARAEAAVQELASDYPNWAIEDVAMLESLVASVRPGASREDPDVAAAFKKAHDMRGQGGSFGYPVITTIGESFCRFTNSLATVDERALKILAAHAKAMRAILANRLSGDGGMAARKLIDGLHAAVRKHHENKSAH